MINGTIYKVYREFSANSSMWGLFRLYPIVFVSWLLSLFLCIQSASKEPAFPVSVAALNHLTQLGAKLMNREVEIYEKGELRLESVKLLGLWMCILRWKRYVIRVEPKGSLTSYTSQPK